MKRFLSLAVVCGALLMPLVSFAQTKASAPAPTQEATPTKATAPTASLSGRTKTSKPVKGIVVSLITLKPVKGADASAMANKNALGLMVGSRIYYVLKADGSSAGDDLARLADAPVGVIGKTMSRGGMTVFLADMIETMK
ncbi:MAG: hypothetical protein ACOVSW_13960 [Candidatus Kapaibacteriota bacterium]